MKFFVTVVGLVLILEGLPYVTSPEAMQRWLRQLTQVPPVQLRIIGLVAMVFGFAVLFFARSSGLLE